MFDTTNPNCRMKLGTLDTTEQVHDEIVQLKRFIAKTNQLEDPSDVVARLT